MNSRVLPDLLIPFACDGLPLVVVVLIVLPVIPDSDGFSCSGFKGA